MRNQVPQKKNAERYQVELPNSQYLYVYFNRLPIKHQGFRRWEVGIYIGHNRKEANKWYNHNGKHESTRATGTCGLTGLRKALDIILDFRSRMKEDEELTVWWADEQRKRAYAYLGRYTFIEYVDEEDKTVCYGTRNPKYWEWTDDETYQTTNQSDKRTI